MSLFSFSTNKKVIATKPKIAHFSLSTQNSWLLWCCQCINIALISAELSSWMLAIIALSFVWQALLLNKNATSHKLSSDKKNSQSKKKPDHHISPVFLGFFAIAGCLAITLSAQGLGVLLSMVHLLSFAYALKAFELKSRRDFYQLFLLGLFLVAAALIFKQDLSFALIAMVALVVNLAVLLQFFSRAQAVSNTLKTVLLLLGQSMFLAAVLFIVFPRLSPFWQVPQANSATTGLSDTVQPGDIAKLAQSSELAFRVNFSQGNIPTYSQLYWRAMVLEDYDGRAWSRTAPDPATVSHDNYQLEAINKRLFMPNTFKESEKLNYQIITEPSFQHWLFALAPATSKDNSLLLLPDYTIQSRKLLSQAKGYHLDSYLNSPLEVNIAQERKAQNLALPARSNPRLVQLAQQLAQQYPDSEQRAQAVLTQIREQQYFYTLEPPRLLNNSLDQFFFDTKAGFCEHYASAFTFIMRASGVPARLVTGYLGGEYNNLSSDGTTNRSNEAQGAQQGHLSIYQSDAHAWSEIWVEGKGWLRVDPTAAVDPMRVNSGFSTQLQQQQLALNNNLLSFNHLKKFAWLNELRLRFDALDYQWTRWVLGYSNDKQRDLLQQLLGKFQAWKVALIIIGAMAISIALVFGVMFLINHQKKQKRALSPWLVLYQKALLILANNGLEKPVNVTPQNFLLIIKIKYPELSLAFARVNASFTRLNYQELTREEQKKEFKKLQQHYKNFIKATKKI
ncbi:DUF3488 and transglutaminase-like domain-containing protein [Colwellia asteriadis]